MTEQEFMEACERSFAQNHFACSAKQAKQLYVLTCRMLEVNKSMNLTAITDEKEVILRHYVDSLTVSAHIPQHARVIDVGCGAGFPSLPLAIFRPDLTILSLDGTAKRIAYVAETARLLGLERLEAVAGRAEELANSSAYRESFDVATARAVASFPILCELCLPFVRVGGQMIAMKSQQATEELMAAKHGISLCGGGNTTAVSCDLVSDSSEIEHRTLILIKKIEETPKKYPRHFSKISKKPL
ncbi:MAG: 16S rRNA (guanine(527)-N(7))-methyltransferase RsmG [Ruminococcaceae bacterium]|nr:16S rRNA (guanine(527)-N(7))-methyltransferase RsmG [Oscillospiraceae bacterium]